MARVLQQVADYVKRGAPLGAYKIARRHSRSKQALRSQCRVESMRVTHTSGIHGFCSILLTSTKEPAWSDA